MLETNNIYSLGTGTSTTTFYNDLLELCEKYESMKSKPEIIVVSSPYVSTGTRLTSFMERLIVQNKVK